MDHSIHNGDARAGTVGGTLLVIILQIDLHEIARTAMQAAVGAAVSFMISFLLKWIVGRYFRK